MSKTQKQENDSLRVEVTEEGARSRSSWTKCQIGANLQFSAEPLASYFFAQWEPIVFDALLLAAAIEFCDKSGRRSALRWTRKIELRLPVHDPTCWSRKDVRESLHDALELLTGDRWHLQFVARKKAVSPPKQGLFNLPFTDSLVVIPFSEGLDSHAVAGLMGRELGDRLIRVRLGTKSDDWPKEHSGRKRPFTAVPYKVRSGDSHRFVESTARSRGFKFALLSGLAAYLAKTDRVIVPESGQGALGPAFVPVGQAYEDYRNHPLFTDKMAEFLKVLFGRVFRFEFPRLWFTKGETLKEYAAGIGPMPADWSNTRSCWQDNRHVSVNKRRRQCGICAACVLRRLRVPAAGLSDAPETYIWENLRVHTFEAGAANGFNKIAAQRDYAIAGTLHLDHLAGLRRSPIYAHSLDVSSSQLARSLSEPRIEIRKKIDRLLGQHEQEWKGFLESLGTNSFIAKWIEQTL
jgi:hypothetical protein